MNLRSGSLGCFWIPAVVSRASGEMFCVVARSICTRNFSVSTLVETATLQAISSKSDKMIRAASMAAKERRALKASIYTCDED